MKAPTGKLKFAYDTIARLEAENSELRSLLTDKVVSETKIREFVARDGEMSASFEGGACVLLAQSLGKQLYESEAENYIEVSFESPDYPDLGQITVTIKRETGRTPHQLRLDAETELRRLKRNLHRAQTAALRQYMHNDGSGLVFGYDKAVIDAAITGREILPS